MFQRHRVLCIYEMDKNMELVVETLGKLFVKIYRKHTAKHTKRRLGQQNSQYPSTVSSKNFANHCIETDRIRENFVKRYQKWRNGNTCFVVTFITLSRGIKLRKDKQSRQLYNFLIRRSSIVTKWQHYRWKSYIDARKRKRRTKVSNEGTGIYF